MAKETIDIYEIVEIISDQTGWGTELLDEGKPGLLRVVDYAFHRCDQDRVRDERGNENTNLGKYSRNL